MKKLLVLLIFIIDISKVSPETMSQEERLFSAVREGCVNEVKNLVNSGVKSDSKDKDGNSLFHLFALPIRYNIISSSMKFCDKYHFPPDEKERLELLKYLLTLDLDLNAKNNYGNTPLHYIVGNYSLNTVKISIQEGADPFAINDSGETILHSATYGYQNEVISYLLKTGLNVNAVDDYKNTPLHNAARSKISTLLLLIESGADVNAINSSGNTPLHYLVTDNLSYSERLEKFKLLVKYGANIRLYNKERLTPYHLASWDFRKYIEKFYQTPVK
ncbi:ankyrin repeat domain-containing protein [Leptospira andrefontaineae]|uniref:Ankyrin repeat domain-containing protein n=1 Tax=Leptospira andrefontaineae TaxID=2484976 RepID=A0A4R9GZU5_9LEPT|nr:ankyrin repeat domain-containing protein [Leptospira andrefontaineae]TGK37240.1 ankyrin repeat domain-containing protein [Leptospira andrefontaineae]